MVVLENNFTMKYDSTVKIFDTSSTGRPTILKSAVKFTEQLVIAVEK